MRCGSNSVRKGARQRARKSNMHRKTKSKRNMKSKSNRAINSNGPDTSKSKRECKRRSKRKGKSSKSRASDDSNTRYKGGTSNQSHSRDKSNHANNCTRNSRRHSIVGVLGIPAAIATHMINEITTIRIIEISALITSGGDGDGELFRNRNHQKNRNYVDNH